MKRIALVVALVHLAIVGFASGLSFGIGGSGSYFKSDAKLTSAVAQTDVITADIPYNLFAYVETTYLQMAVGYRFFNGLTIKGPSGAMDDSSHYSYVSLAGYVKLPLHLGSVTLIPMIGVEYDITIAAIDGSGVSFTRQQKRDLNALRIKGGLGAEILFSPSVYFRPEFLFGYQLNNQADQNTISSYKNSGYDDASILTLNFELAILFGVKL